MNRAFFVDVLSSFLTSTKFTRYELHELVAPTCEAESAAAASDPATRALEAAHALAFRSGLGNSIFAASGHHVSSEDVKAYAQSVFSQGNVAVVGTGIDASTLEKLLEKSLGSSFASASAASSTPSTYFGGETRVDAHDGPQTVFIGLGTTGAPSAELAVLAAHLDPTPSVKWSQGTSPIAAKLPAGASVRSVLLPYSDASLFGLLVQGETSADVKAAGQAAVQALKASGSLSGDDLQKAVAKAKFAAASSFDAREGLLAALGPKVSTLSGSPSTSLTVPLIRIAPLNFKRSCLVPLLPSPRLSRRSRRWTLLRTRRWVLSSLLSTRFHLLCRSLMCAWRALQAAASLLKTKPTYVAVGDVASLPYADELGL